jgi:hypothetical protein
MKARINVQEDHLLEEIEMAKEALFRSRTIKEAKFWQEKIAYLNSLLNKNKKFKYLKSK